MNNPTCCWKNHVCLVLGAVLLLLGTAPVWGEDTPGLDGKWLVKKTNEAGDTFTQTIEIKKDKFVFQIKGSDGQLVIHAEGDVKLEKLGPFSSARYFHIRGGNSPSNLNDVDDEFTTPYVLEGDTWIVASNFDKPRDQKPTVDTYQRVKEAGRALVIDSIEMAETPQGGTWYFFMEAKVEGVTRRYYVPNKGFETNRLTIPVALEFPGAKAGQKCSFKVQLDDIDNDVTTDEVDNRGTGDFEASEKGAKEFKPEDGWRFTVRWHLK